MRRHDAVCRFPSAHPLPAACTPELEKGDILHLRAAPDTLKGSGFDIGYDEYVPGSIRTLFLPLVLKNH